MLVMRTTEPFWTSVFTACIANGKTFEEATSTADRAVLAKEVRFRHFLPEEKDRRLGGGMSLQVALEFFERHALVGLQVIVAGTTDVPAMGKLRDFRNGVSPCDGEALVSWESGGPADQKETWVKIQALQLIAGLEV